MKTISLEELKIRIEYGLFYCIETTEFEDIKCEGCVFSQKDDCLRDNYNFAAIAAHDFGTLTEVVIDDLEQFKIK